MSTRQDRQDIDFSDRSTAAAPGASESPTDLADSPTVNRPEDEISPAVAARADLPEQPGVGMMENVKANPLPVQNPDAAAIMTRRSRATDPGSPLGGSLGAMPADDLSGDALNQSDIGHPMPGAEATEVPDRGGTAAGPTGVTAGLDETTGTDDASARGGQRRAE